jgi:hypothetical protein
MVTFASFAFQGVLGLRPIAWPLRVVLFACAVATVSPRFDVTAAATVIGALALLAVWRLARPVPVAAPVR